jgi:hypothetical protein
MLFGIVDSRAWPAAWPAEPHPKEYRWTISSSGMNACTLNPPVSGPQSQQGDDGKSVFVVSNSAFAHTITTPANKIIGSRHLCTFTAGIGNCLELRAYNGLWVPVAMTGVTVT